MRTLRLLFSLLVACFLTACIEQPTLPKQGASPAHKSPKRGVAFNFSNAEDLPLLSPSISWAYNWGNAQNDIASLWFDTNDMDFCPMCWNDQFDAERIRQYVALHPSTRYLLGFNEPNLTDQCNMTPAQAAKHWPEVVALAKELGLKLVSPAMNYGTLSGYSDPIKWLDEFFACEGVNIDDIHALSIHCYMASPSAAKSFVERFAKYNKPIWLTEFCAWEQSVSSPETQMGYMCSMLHYLERSPLVERYAWFIPRSSGRVDSYPFMQLLDHASPTSLTELGYIYTLFPTFDSTAYLPAQSYVPAGQYIASSSEQNPLRYDGNGGLYRPNMSANNWLEYQIFVDTDAPLSIRYSSLMANTVCVYIDGNALGFVSLPKTETIQTVSTFLSPLSIPQGRHTLRLEWLEGSCHFYGFSTAPLSSY